MEFNIFAGVKERCVASGDVMLIFKVEHDKGGWRELWTRKHVCLGAFPGNVFPGNVQAGTFKR